MPVAAIANSKSKTFFAFCSSFLTGVLIATEWPIDIFLIYLAIIISFVLLSLLWKNKSAKLAIICCLCLAVGMTRFIIAFPTADNHVSKLNGQTVQLTGYVATEPDVRTDGARYIVNVSENDEMKVVGSVYVLTGLYPRYTYGDLVTFNCNLARPEPIVPEDGGRVFRYDMYMARLDVFAMCYRPHIERIGLGEGNIIIAKLLQLKTKVAKEISLLWHEPYASFMAGLLYGYRGGLGDLQNDFSRTGVSHIVAVSGYNIALIGSLFLYIFVHGFWINRKRAFWLVAFCILLFVIFTGMSASVVRAGIMGILVLTAQQIGRQSSPANLLMLAAALMVLQNPFILRWDAGFQLSFAATAGLAYLAPVFDAKLRRFSTFLGFKELFIQTSAAIIATLPLLLYQFGAWSIVAPIVNLLVVGLVPFLMIGGFVTVLTSMASASIGKFLSWIIWAGLEYIVQVVRWFSELPFATVEVEFPLWAVIVSYGVIFWFIYRMNNRKQLVIPTGATTPKRGA